VFANCLGSRGVGSSVAGAGGLWAASLDLASCLAAPRGRRGKPSALTVGLVGSPL